MTKKKDPKKPSQDERRPPAGLRGLIGAARAGQAEVPQSERRSYAPDLGPEEPKQE